MSGARSMRPGVSSAWRWMRRRASRRRAVAGLALALALGATLGTVACRRGERYDDAPIILISIDTLRSDHLGAYGAKTGATPHLDALAKDGILFERAYSQYPLTLPSHVTLLSGELPGVHGVRDNAGYPFDGVHHSFLPRLLKEHGYTTGAAVSAFVLRAQSGLATGFDFYEASLRPGVDETADLVQRPGGETARLALDWLGQHREGKPPFLFFHIYEPHFPYEPPEPFRSRFARHYDGEVATADDIVGKFLQQLKDWGLYDKAIIVLLSDHGEGLDEHGEGQHGFFLYRSTLQVPLLLKLPKGAHAGLRVKDPVALIDVAPTLLRLAGADVPKALTGRSLLDTALAGGELPERSIYAETFYPRLHFGWSELYSLVRGRLHYMHGPQPELFDLPADPGELHNVLGRERRAYAALRDELARMPHDFAAPSAVDAETAKQLAALGYAAGSVKTTGPLPDPRTKVPVLIALGDAVTAARNGQEAEAARLYAQVLATDPQMSDAWFFYARALEKLGRNEEAVAAFEKALELGGTQPKMAAQTANKMISLGKIEEGEKLARAVLREAPEEAYDALVAAKLERQDVAGAQALLREAAAAGHASESSRREVGRVLAEQGRPEETVALLQPLAEKGDPPTLDLLGISLSDIGRQDEARAVLQRAVSKDPSNAVAYQSLGMVALRQQQPQQAREYLQRALQINDKLAIAWNTLGVARYQLEGAAPAIEAWQRSVALDPHQYDAWFNIGLVAAESGRTQDARAALRQFVAIAPPQKFGPDIQKAQGVLRQLGG